MELGTPSLLDDGTVLFGARKTNGDEGLYSVHASLGSSATIGLVLPLFVEAGRIALHLHSILTVSVASNEQADSPIWEVQSRVLPVFLSSESRCCDGA